MENKLSKNDDNFEKRKNEFYKNINILYTSCTRAKEVLSIVLSDSPRESIYSELLSKALINLSTNSRKY